MIGHWRQFRSWAGWAVAFGVVAGLVAAQAVVRQAAAQQPPAPTTVSTSAPAAAPSTVPAAAQVAPAPVPTPVPAAAPLPTPAPAAAPAPQAAQPAVPPSLIVEIRVEGNKVLSANAILNDVRSRVGEAYDDNVVKADEKRLLQTGRFDSVATRKIKTDRGIVLVFDVVERPKIDKVEIVGGKAFKLKDLQGEVGIKAGDPLSEFSIQTGRQALLTKYRGDGYYFVEVTVDKAALARQQVIYRITEGPRSLIRKIQFKGNDFFGSLSLWWKIGSRSRLWPIFTGNIDNEQVEQDIQTIRNAYVGEGFLDAKVTRFLDFSDDKTKATLTFVIEEGPRYRVNRIIFRGNTVFSGDELAKRLIMHQGSFFTAENIKHDTEAAQYAYGELGFIEARVDLRKQFLPPNATLPAWAQSVKGGKVALLNVVFEITENDQYRIGKIDIRGNSLTQQRVIRRELRFYPEQLYDTVAVEESRKRLMETRLFEKVNITPTGKQPGVRDALVQVQEGKTAEFLLGVGVSSNNGLLGNVTLTQRNFDIFGWPTSRRTIAEGQAFKGAGQTLSLVAQPGTELMSFHIDWENPYIFDKPYSLANRIYYFDRQRETYKETRVGDVASLGHRFDNGWYGEVSGRAESVDIHNLDSNAPPEVIEDRGTHFLTGPRLTIVRDRTDSRFTPSTGDRLRLSYEEILGSYMFGRATGDYHTYYTLYKDALDRKHVLSGKVAAGQIFGDAPVFETFYGGGTGSVRGFQYRGISPRSPGTDQPIGGNWMFLAGSEYEYPLIGNQVRGVFFLDTGTVEKDTGFSTYRAAVGLGFRWLLPIFGTVPMSFDFGFPILKDSQDDTQIFSFNIGLTF